MSNNLCQAHAFDRSCYVALADAPCPFCQLASAQAELEEAKRITINAQENRHFYYQSYLTQKARAEAAERERDELQAYHRASVERLYEMLGIDKSDGEIRFKWAALEVTRVVRERDELKRLVDMRTQITNNNHVRIEELIKERDELREDMNKLREQVERLKKNVKGEQTINRIGTAMGSIERTNLTRTITGLESENQALREENERYRKALEDIADGNGEDCKDCVYNTKIAADALEGQKPSGVL